ncbi:MAG: hypothetical protein AAFX50_09940, partial [Acidobacteriota bacterium]
VTLFKTSIPFTEAEEEERYQLKGTLNLFDKHQIQATYTDRDETDTDTAFSFSSTPSTVTTRTLPSELRVLRYSGVLTDSLFAEVQASEKLFGFRREAPTGVSNIPSTDPAFVENTPFRDFFGSFNGHYNAPYFDGTDPEDRDNEQISASLSYFADSASFGSHDLKVGFEDFSSFRVGGNSQTPTDWVLSSDVVRDAAGNPVITNGELEPDWIPGTSIALNWLATRGAEVEIQTRSFFINDIWQLNDKWSFNIGARYEDVSGETNSNITTVDSDALVPRLAATYDVRGDGKYRFDATYSEYAGKYSEAQFAQNTDVGNPALLAYVYAGPAGQGYDFAPAYDIDSNYQIFLVNDGTQNVLVDEGISSPTVEEITFSAGIELDRGGFLKAIFTDRAYSDFVEDFITPDTGSTLVEVEGNPAGTFNNTFITNSDLPVREYQAIQLIGRTRLSDNWTLDGNYTYQIKNDGNFEGEGTNTPGISSIIGNYPEIRSAASHFPTGALNDFAENKLRLWTNYSLNFDRIGSLNFGLLANWDSGRTFSRTDSVALSPTQAALIAERYDGPGPANQTVFFGGRGGVEFDDSLTFDLSVNYQLPLFSDIELWLKADVLNIFDSDTQIAGDTNVDFDPDGRVDELGIPLDFTEPSGFGDARNNSDFDPDGRVDELGIPLDFTE